MNSNFITHPLGWMIEDERKIVFFGNREANYEALTKAFPQLVFKRVRQIHGNRVIPMTVQSADYETEADASYTKSRNIALCSITADCVPVLIHDATNQLAMAIHAGWRGVAARILPRALQVATEQGVEPRHLRIWVGPHIRQDSFEVEEDALSLLARSTILPRDQFSIPKDGKKSTVSLQTILESQLREFGILKEHHRFLEIDSVTDARLHSHRRDREKAGRQISFIVLKS